MSLATLEGNYGPDPEDLGSGSEFEAIVGRIRGSSIAEPFTEAFAGELTPRDLEMRAMLGDAAESGYFAEAPDEQAS